MLVVFVASAMAVAGPSPIELGSLAIHLPNGIDVHCETALVSFAPQPARGGVTRRFGFADMGDGCDSAAVINDHDVHTLMVLPRGACLLHEQSRRLLSAAGEAVIIVGATHDLRADASAEAAADARGFELARGSAEARALVRPAVLVSNATGALIRAHVATYGPQLAATLRPPAPRPCEPEMLAAHWLGWSLALLSATAALGAMGRRTLQREPSSYELLARRSAAASPTRWRECEMAARLALLASPCADGVSLLVSLRALATGGAAAVAAAREGRHGALLAHADAHVESAATRAELVLLGLGAGAQLLGCACVVASGAPALRRVRRQGCALLLGWLAAHPLLYGHEHDMQLLATTASILGGLLLLWPAPVPADERARAGARASGARGALEGACARLLATAVLAHCGARPLLERLATGYTASDPLSRTLAEAKVAAASALLCAHAAIGFESRRNALLLVCVLVGANLVLRPLWPVGARPGGPDPFAHTPDGLVDMASRAESSWFLYMRSLSAAGALALLAVHAKADGPTDGALPVLADKSHDR